MGDRGCRCWWPLHNVRCSDLSFCWTVRVPDHIRHVERCLSRVRGATGSADDRVIAVCRWRSVSSTVTRTWAPSSPRRATWAASTVTWRHALPGASRTTRPTTSRTKRTSLKGECWETFHQRVLRGNEKTGTWVERKTSCYDSDRFTLVPCSRRRSRSCLIPSIRITTLQDLRRPFTG